MNRFIIIIILNNDESLWKIAYSFAIIFVSKLRSVYFKELHFLFLESEQMEKFSF